MQNGHLISVDKLSKCFGRVVVVNEVSFNVGEGEVMGLLGPNGAGKTTLMRMLTTLTPATSGTARVAGYDICTNPTGVRNSIGVIPQAFTSDPELTAEENLLIHAKLYGVPANRRQSTLREALDAVDLTKFGRSLVGTFSGGMRRRLEIARGLMHSPKVLFLDEPTTGLDPVSRIHVWEMINKLKKRSQMTVLLTTHYMDEADKFCDRVAIIDNGHLLVLDTPSRLKASVAKWDLLRVEFTGAPPSWEDMVIALPDVAQVDKSEVATAIYSRCLPNTLSALMNTAHAHNVGVRNLTVQETSLDDVFMHYTGRQLRDEVARGKP